MGRGALNTRFNDHCHFPHRKNPRKRRCFFSCSEYFFAWLTQSAESSRIYLLGSFRQGLALAVITSFASLEADSGHRLQSLYDQQSGPVGQSSCWAYVSIFKEFGLKCPQGCSPQIVHCFSPCGIRQACPHFSMESNSSAPLKASQDL